MSYYARRGAEMGASRGRGVFGRGGRGFRGRPGLPSRGPLGVNTRQSSHTIAKSFNRSKDMIWRNDLFNDSMVASGVETGTRLYISNLERGVSPEDIKELFSEIGHLRRYAVHYDGFGNPNGTAEVVYTRRSDAIAALKRYNNVLLDGKAMKIDVIGADLGLPVKPRVNVVGSANGRGKRTVVMTRPFAQRGGNAGSSARGGRAPTRISGWNRGGFQAGRGRGGGGRGFRGRGRGRGGPGGVRKQWVVKTADELDKELESYHAEAMQT